MIMVEYDSNNSGGSWWLSDEDWVALYDAGWQLKRDYDDCRYSDNGNATEEDDKHNWSLDPREAIKSDKRWLRAITTTARKEFGSMREAVEEWQSITGQDPSELGCFTCCGPPHNFSGKDSNGTYVPGPEITISKKLSF